MGNESNSPGRELAEGERYERATQVLDKILPSWRNHASKSSSSSPSPVAQDFAQLCVEHCYADAWSRKAFDLKTRSIITITALAAMGCQEELKLHVRAAMNLGHKPNDILEIFIQLIPYVGVPKMTQAMRNAGEAFAQAFQDQKKA